MFLWYIGLSVLIVVNVFRSSGVDYRLIAVGALLPLLVDLPVGHRAFGHTLLFPVAVLLLVMVGTIGRPRLLRRRLLCLPIGIFCGLVLSGAFASGAPFLWPFFGGFANDALLPVWRVVLLLEFAGLVACWWIVGQYDLFLRGPRDEFRHTGRLEESAPPAD